MRRPCMFALHDMAWLLKKALLRLLSASRNAALILASTGHSQSLQESRGWPVTSLGPRQRDFATMRRLVRIARVARASGDRAACLACVTMAVLVRWNFYISKARAQSLSVRELLLDKVLIISEQFRPPQLLSSFTTIFPIINVSRYEFSITYKLCLGQSSSYDILLYHYQEFR